ncbi:undecaprenyl/decaprenyl-phosphate alpha-N-acetylglucosaminyl 1-phosphate transferase [Microtetraspora sp. AC03309]|uniref:glycosyltransferase family 4 protein n=1 Tax=Microtetraspora sp. AC03309 TaxID=2779376 RepID=UPI001E2F3363|nr:MraY family glycosyltransferase [Microtetraspora sp. AC03309]MCC5574103.1 undecaprenyl/decaprenyl-phosphate alpha-N-acetylglucosaminyl 1-phosphate transferase [Microtetraspora sp. AC03309]
MREYLLLALVTAAVTYLLVPPVRVFALRIGAAPEVRERDVHKVPIPRLGGLAMFGGMAAGLLLATHLPYVGGALATEQAGQTVTALLVAGGVIVLTGFLDDWLGMDALVKLGGQVAAGGLLVYFGMYLPWLPLPKDMGGSTGLDPNLRTIITIMIVVVVINAVNFVDGLDGLAAGIVGIAALATFAYSIALSQDSSGSRINVTAAIAAILIGMCLGFLPHNFNPAKIFMGDTGAMLIGMLLATSLITIISSVDSGAIDRMNKFPVVLPLLLPIAVMILPLLDLVMAVVRRTSAGLSPFAPDRGHLHHRLLDIGHSQRRSVLIMYGWTFLFSFTLVGLSIGGVPLIVFPLTVVLAIAVLIMMASPRWRSRKGGRRDKRARDKGEPGQGGAHLPGGHASGIGTTDPSDPGTAAASATTRARATTL